MEQNKNLDVICTINEKTGLPKHTSFYEPGDKYVCYDSRDCVYKRVNKEKYVCKFTNDLMSIKLNYTGPRVTDNRYKPSIMRIVYKY